MQKYEHFWLTYVTLTRPLLNRVRFSESKRIPNTSGDHALSLAPCLRKLKNLIPKIKWNNFLHMYLDRSYQSDVARVGHHCIIYITCGPSLSQAFWFWCDCFVNNHQQKAWDHGPACIAFLSSPPSIMRGGKEGYTCRPERERLRKTVIKTCCCGTLRGITLMPTFRLISRMVPDK